jgi:hypothetical protein
MEQLELFSENIMSLLPLIIILVIWEVIWKMFALWKSARSNHRYWFISIALLNTLGLLPILYLLTFRKKPQKTSYNTA